ncbi:uncharacterized protein LOC144158523 isoform X2 [Haemaphysalis longicornis]
MPKSCAVATSVYAASNRNVLCSQKTQTAITTSARGAQCALTFLTSASSQTEKKFPGTAAAMERKRRRVAVASLPATTAPKRKCSCGKEDEPAQAKSELETAREKVSALEQELEAAERKVKRYKEERDEARAMVDVQKLVKKLTKAVDAFSAGPSAVAAPVQKVDIGNNVLVDTQLLAHLKLSARNQPTKFARNLLRAVFSPEELAHTRVPLLAASPGR